MIGETAKSAEKREGERGETAIPIIVKKKKSSAPRSLTPGISCGRAPPRALIAPSEWGSGARPLHRELGIQSLVGKSILGHFSFQTSFEPLFFNLQVIARLKVQPRTIRGALQVGCWSTPISGKALAVLVASVLAVAIWAIRRRRCRAQR
jgi:hypothetical protein